MAAGFADSMKSALEGIGIGLGVAGLTEAIKKVVEYEDQIGLAAKSTGMTSEQMSGLAYAAKQFEVPLHDVTMGLAYFDRVEGGLMRSKQGQTAMKLLGLSVRDLNGNLKSSHAMLAQVADKFAGLKDSTEKTAVATALFGQTYGLEMIPLLDQGSKGIAALEAKAKQLGVTLSEDDVQSAVKAESAMHDLNAAILGLEVSASKRLLPALTVISEAMSGDSSAMREMKDGAEVLGLEMEKIALELQPGHVLFGAWDKQIALLQRKMNDLATDQILAFQEMKKSLPDLTDLSLNPQLHITPLGANGAHINKVADAIRSLKQELTGLSEGPVSKGVQHLRDLGASRDQIAQGAALLTQIQGVKEKQKAQEQYNGALGSYKQLVSSLSYAVSGLDAPEQEYMKTVAQLNGLQLKGIDITNGLTLAHERYREELMAGFKTPEEMGIKAPAGNAAGGNIFTPGSQNYLGSRFDQLQGKAKELGKTLQTSFVGMIVDGQNYAGVLKNLTTLFAEFILKAVVFKQLSSAFGTTGAGGLIGSFFGGLAGGKASGGPVTAGSLYMVGESGPELFAPGMSGSIIPNGGFSARGGSTVNIDARGSDAGVEHRIMRAMEAQQKKMMGGALVAQYEYHARGGTL
ncbi:MAG: hypothetical protein ACRD2P_08965 [Terriglobia bacterium]